MGIKVKLNIRRCKQCNEHFKQVQPLQYLCMPPKDCSWKYQAKLKENKENKEWRDKKAVMKSDLFTHKDWLNLLQVTFNTFIRLRDKGKPCISCNLTITGKYDAGHFYSVGGYPNLRFDEDNVHAQCVSCNQWSHGNLIMYAENLPLRIGIDRAENLKEKRYVVSKISIPEIKEKLIYYKLKIKELNLSNKTIH